MSRDPRDVRISITGTCHHDPDGASHHHKGSTMIGEYIAKMKGLADDMASAGKKIKDEELVSYILTGLDEPLDPMVRAMVACVEPITVSDLFTQVVTDLE